MDRRLDDNLLSLLISLLRSCISITSFIFSFLSAPGLVTDQQAGVNRLSFALMAAGSPLLSPPRTLSEIQRKHEKRERKEREAQREREKMEHQRQKLERELRQISNERREVQRRAIRAQQERDQAWAIVGGAVLCFVLVGLVVGSVVWWKRKQEKKRADASAGAGGMIQHANVAMSGEANPFGVYGLNEPHMQAYSPFQYQPQQPMFVTAPGSPVDSMDPAGFSPLPSYSDAPPAYNSGNI